MPSALGNLAAQLIIRFGLDGQASGGMLPDWARTPDGFESLLAAAARAEGRQGPVMLVADGLDEADTPAGGMPFGLPLLLPDGVFVIGTYRTGRSPRRPDALATVLTIGKHDPRNRRDIDDYLADVAGDEVLAARLAQSGTNPAAFTALLAERCGGVWVYLRYVLHELRIGLRRPDEVSALPAGLDSYYADQVRRWQQDPAWDTALLPLLATLGAVGEPLTAASLARLGGGLDPAAVQRGCDLILRPLLTTVRPLRASGLLRYEIYHASFRELLNGYYDDWPGSAGSPGGQGYELVVLAGELGQATAAAHSCISDVYLKSFGGLDAGLPALAADPGGAGIDDGYPLRHLTRHLCAAGRAAELHALLAADHPADGNREVNTWFAAHDHADSVSLYYLADLARARADSAAATDRDLHAGHLAPSLGIEIRYALMAASVAAISDKIPDDLLEQLIRTGVWSSRRGLDHARRIVDARSRFDALLAVCGQLKANDQPAVFAQALATATAITSDYPRARALARLAPHLPADLLPQALTVATAITDDSARATALTRLAPHLPADLLPQALTVATAITDDSARAEALAGLAPYLPEAERPAVLAQALTAATAITDDYPRASALTGLAPHLPEDERPADLLPQALTAATAITSDSARASALAGLAPHLPEDERPAVLAQALTAATAITDDYVRATALSRAGAAPARRPPGPGPHRRHRHH